jgi:hypothetical protein
MRIEDKVLNKVSNLDAQLGDLLLLIDLCGDGLQALMRRIEHLEQRQAELEKMLIFGKNQRTSPVEN